MITTEQKQSLLGRWAAEGLAPTLRELLANPVMQRALEIIEAHAEPHDLAIQRMTRELGANAPFAISITHAVQAGERRMLRMLKNLTTIIKQEDAAAVMNTEPFAYITEQYLEQR